MIPGRLSPTTSTPGADCVTALRAAWAADHRYVIVTGNVKIDGDANAAITATYTKSLAVTVPPAAATSAARRQARTSWASPGAMTTMSGSSRSIPMSSQE